VVCSNAVLTCRDCTPVTMWDHNRAIVFEPWLGKRESSVGRRARNSIGRRLLRRIIVCLGSSRRPKVNLGMKLTSKFLWSSINSSKQI